MPDFHSSKATQAAISGGEKIIKRRVGGRTRLHHEQKQSSRQSLLESANYLFVNHSYAATTVDDIVKKAHVSRATFYRHFDDKWAIANEIFGQLDSTFLALYDELASYDDPSEAQISEWLNRLLEILKAHKPLVRAMREADTIERESDNTPTIMHEALISRLAKRIPAFQLAASATEKGVEARVGAHLLMLQFDEFCYAVAVRGSIDCAIGVRVMARLFRRFIEEYPRSPEEPRAD
jgi:AcrR family transcriptional regulator